MFLEKYSLMFFVRVLEFIKEFMREGVSFKEFLNLFSEDVL